MSEADEGGMEMKAAVPKGTNTTERSNADDCGVVSTNSSDVVYEWVGWGSLSRQERYDLIGWICFIISATFYTVAAVEFSSLTSLLGSLAFLIACFFFMIPLLRKEKLM